MSSPAMWTRARVGRSSPASRCISVDLPEPDGPMTAVNWPRGDARARRRAGRRRRPRRRRSGGSGPGADGGAGGVERRQGEGGAVSSMVSGAPWSGFSRRRPRAPIRATARVEGAGGQQGVGGLGEQAADEAAAGADGHGGPDLAPGAGRRRGRSRRRSATGPLAAERQPLARRPRRPRRRSRRCGRPAAPVTRRGPGCPPRPAARRARSTSKATGAQRARRRDRSGRPARPSGCAATVWWSSRSSWPGASQRPGAPSSASGLILGAPGETPGHPRG